MSTTLESKKCCACGRRGLAVLALAVLLAAAVTGWAITANDRNRSAAAPAGIANPEPKQPNEQARPVVPPPVPMGVNDRVEQVEVWVAVKDLPVGTIFTKAELPTLAVKKTLPKDSLPPSYVTNEEELFDKRLTRAVYKNATFDPAAVTKGNKLYMPEGLDMVTVPFSSQTVAFVAPGSKVDIIGALQLGKHLKAFPLLIDVLVLAVDTTPLHGKEFVYSVSFAVTQQQALMLALAKEGGCHLELLIRNPNKPIDENYDVVKVMKFLQAMTSKETARSIPEAKNVQEEGTPLAPAPRSKGD